MASFQDLTTAQLRQILQLREQIETAQQKLDTLLGGTSSTTKTKKKVGKRTMSPATIEKMRAAQQARWAHLKEAPAKAAPIKMVAKKKGGITAAGRAKLAAAMKARWEAKRKGTEVES